MKGWTHRRDSRNSYVDIKPKYLDNFTENFGTFKVYIF